MMKEVISIIELNDIIDGVPVERSFPKKHSIRRILTEMCGYPKTCEGLKALNELVGKISHDNILALFCHSVHDMSPTQWLLMAYEYVSENGDAEELPLAEIRERLDELNSPEILDGYYYRLKLMEEMK